MDLRTAGRSTMIMPRRNDPLLMPVNPLFIWSTLAFAFLLNIVPLGRMAQPEEIARIAVFLASDDAAMMTGELMHVNGGVYMA